jgi:hypothetical protein
VKPETLRALLEEYEAEAKRRLEDKIAKGDFVAGPFIVVGHPDCIERAKAAAITALRQRGEQREIVWGASDVPDIFVTGVPRPNRDEGVDPWPVSIPENTFKPPAPKSEPEPEPEPVQESPKPVGQGRVTIQVRGPDPERGDPGEVAIGLFTAFSDGTVEVRNEDDCGIGTGRVEPGGDAALWLVVF